MERVVVPPRIRVWSKDDWYIYFDPHNFVWVRVNESGRLLLELFRKYMTPPQIVDYIVGKFGLARDKAAEAVQAFVDSVVASGFLHHNEYRERDRSIFPQLDFPQDIYLHMTNNCNLKCPYCYNKSDRETKIKLEKIGMVAPTLNTQEFKDLIARIIDCGVHRILFTGGEPLMRPDVLELVQFARSKSETVKLEMLTNAILITDEVAEILCKNMTSVTISLDGHEKHMHEYYRGKNTFEPTVRGIRRLVAKKKELGQAHQPYICIVPALTERNIVKMKDIFEYSLDDLGASGLAPIIFQAGDHQDVNIAQIPALDVYLEAMDQTAEYLKSRAARNGKTVTPTASPIGPRNHCGVGHGEISVDPGGFVYPCQSLHFDEFICGNVREYDIKEIFKESAVMKRMRSTTVDTIAVCSHCDLRYLCNAGCRATAYNVYREFDAHNEIYCNYLEMVAVGKMWGTSHVSLAPS
ncbi:MAG TPA: radical SAM protein [Pyrinomonadaceae bacterium]|nr:radical SAM protein [Pyrinomonadaceae bacterium]